MPHIMSFFDKDTLAAWDLEGRDVTVEIEAVTGVELPAQQGKKAARKPMLKFRGKKKTMVLNVTNARVVANMYGPNTKEWIGKRIIIFPTTTQFGRETVECIRVRNRMPQSNQQQAEPPLSPADEEKGDAHEPE